MSAFQAHFIDLNVSDGPTTLCLPSLTTPYKALMLPLKQPISYFEQIGTP